MVFQNQHSKPREDLAVRKPRAKKPLYLYPANIMFKALSRMGVSLGAINVLTVAGRVSGPVMTAFPAAVPHGVRLFKALGLVNGATQTNLPLPPTTLLPSKSCLHQPPDALPIHRRQADRPPEGKWRRGTRPRTPGERVSLSAGAPSANPATSWQQPSAYYKGEPP